MNFSLPPGLSVALGVVSLLSLAGSFITSGACSVSFLVVVLSDLSFLLIVDYQLFYHNNHLYLWFLYNMDYPF